MTVLSVEGVHSGYGAIEVLHGVSVSVEEGQIVTLIGGNGAGKTTLLKTISGLLKATAGRISFRGTDIARLPAHRIVEQGISQAPEGRGMLKRMTVVENLKMGAHLRRDGEVDDDVQRLLQKFPALAERKNQVAGLLSGGEQQMLTIARALMSRPRLLLLDEPSLGLAPMIVTEIFRTLRELNEEGMTIFLIEQNARRALQLAHRAYVLERGNIVMEGGGDELLTNPQVQHMYLGRTASERSRARAPANGSRAES